MGTKLSWLSRPPYQYVPYVVALHWYLYDKPGWIAHCVRPDTPSDQGVPRCLYSTNQLRRSGNPREAYLTRCHENGLRY